MLENSRDLTCENWHFEHASAKINTTDSIWQCTATTSSNKTSTHLYDLEGLFCFFFFLALLIILGTPVFH